MDIVMVSLKSMYAACRAMKRGALVAAVACCFAVVAHGAEDASPYPPEPQMPETSKDTPREEARAAFQKWRVAHDAWEKKLTIGQYLEWKKNEAEKHRQKYPGIHRRNHLTRLPEPGGDYDWKQYAAAKKIGEATIASLENQKAAYGPSVKQSFEPYLGGPVFITTDSLLNGFHVLFEDSFRELELRKAYRFAGDLEDLLGAMRRFVEKEGKFFPEERSRAALRHAQLVLGPAIVIAGGSLKSFDADLSDEIMAQAEKIRRADAVELPSWLAPVDENTLVALDYRRCKPVGFYSTSEKLSAYFRAVRWLQMVPLRGVRVAEFDVAVLMGLAGEENGLAERFQDTMQLIGSPDDPSPFDLRRILDSQFPREFHRYDGKSPDVQSLVARKLLESDLYQINSDIRLDTKMDDAFASVSFRLMPAARLRDAVLFQKLMNRRIAPRGKMVAALLGSDFALEKLPDDARKIVSGARETRRNEWADPHYLEKFFQAGGLVHERYLNVLDALFLPVPAEAPPFMKEDFWKAKSCQTALGGWAQMRHTFTLQAKQSVRYFGLVEVPPGFVEPNPEFYARMTSLLEAAYASLQKAGCFSPSEQVVDEELQQKAGTLKRMQARFDANDTMKRFVERVADAERDMLMECSEIVRAYAPGKMYDALASEDPKVFQEAFQKLVCILEERKGVATGTTMSWAADEPDLRSRWESLISITGKLQTLALKQLYKQPWKLDEEIFLKLYGERMAAIMGYFGNSWLSPRDDAPRWVEVARNPIRDSMLAVAVGRPQYIYVLYPWNGYEVLCRGSVMQYYEYDAKGAPLTDGEWRRLLDSTEAPPIPEWLREFADAPGKPAERH